MPNAKSTTVVESSRNGDVATVRFVTDSGVSIFSSRVLGELGNIVERLAVDHHLRFVVFRGAGKTFVAGADIAEMSHFSEDEGLAFSRHGQHVMDAIEALPHVTIAAINGHALGGGCELSLACDFRLAVVSAKIGQPESRLGLIPGWGGTQRLPRVVGLSAARRLMFSGESISAEAAREIGLIDEVTPDVESLDIAGSRLVSTLSAGSPAAINRVKNSLRSGQEAEQFALCFSCADAKEGITAFHEKRPAPWMPK